VNPVGDRAGFPQRSANASIGYSTDVDRRRIGVVGAGIIGLAVARRLTQLDPEVTSTTRPGR
jgi:lactate dehydrogenase-like 2-hydroxyacid dehydrogenase